MTTLTAQSTDKIYHAPDHDSLSRHLRQRLQALCEDGTTVLFRTDANPEILWQRWLGGLEEPDRQHHNCHACRRFLQTYGGLATIDADGRLQSALFAGDADYDEEDGFATSRALVRIDVNEARVAGVAVLDKEVLGTIANHDKKRGVDWTHLHVLVPSGMRYKGKVLTASQRAAELAQDREVLLRSISDFPLKHVQTALAIAKSDLLYRGEKVVDRLEWFANLIESLDKGRTNNLVWLAVATAPVGFTHVRPSVVGTLLEDLTAGKSLEECKRAFAAKMHPLQYQRPTAPPTEGAIRQAEKLVDTLGITPSLGRRHARLEEIQTIWKPRTNRGDGAGESSSVFDHLRDAGPTAPRHQIGSTMTWEKFARLELEGAESIEVAVPGTGAFHGLTTAVDPAAPPILQWDSETARNPIAWYTYHGANPASKWNLVAGQYVKVTGICEMPNMWGEQKHEHQGKGVILILDGCRDTSPRVGLCLFPEILKSELNPVRRVIEAHSNKMSLEGGKEATAAGLAIRAGSSHGPTRIRVTSAGVTTEHTIDRWD